MISKKRLKIHGGQPLKQPEPNQFQEWGQQFSGSPVFKRLQKRYPESGHPEMEKDVLWAVSGLASP